MNTYSQLKEELSLISQDISTLLTDVQSIYDMPQQSLSEWQEKCLKTKKQIAEDVVRIAVVGTIKSGKSTFTNSLLKGDYLKRGAGVVTSIVTRIRKGRSKKALLYFKPWDEINGDIKNALPFLPTLKTESRNGFDIRESQHRQALTHVLETLSVEDLIRDDTRDRVTFLLGAYLKGFKTVWDLTSSENTCKELSDGDFSKHQALIGNEVTAAYLKDVLLKIHSLPFAENVEIADCQGSDSSNPLHLAMIQDYLLLSHFIIYVISSRTGLRQADIKFLSMIRKMGIMENVLFVVNVDLSEHESGAELRRLIEKTKNELDIFAPQANVHSFSALLNLFQSMKSQLNAQDEMRLKQWELDEKTVEFSHQQTHAFEKTLTEKLIGQRNSLLFSNHVQRLAAVIANINNWIGVQHKMLSQNNIEVLKIDSKIKRHQEKLQQITGMIRNTYGGAVQQIKKDVRKRVDTFFDFRYGTPLKELSRHIRGFELSDSVASAYDQADKFSNALLMVVQEFKNHVDRHLTEVTNPEILRFVKGLEKEIHNDLQFAETPFKSMVERAIEDYNATMSSLELGEGALQVPAINAFDWDAIKNITGVSLPPVGELIRCSIKIKTEARFRFAIYKMIQGLKTIFKQNHDVAGEDQRMALRDAVARMKRETEEYLKFYFNNYKENIKFQYFFKITDSAAHELQNNIVDAFQVYIKDISQILTLVDQQKINKEVAISALQQSISKSHSIDRRIKQARALLTGIN